MRSSPLWILMALTLLIPLRTLAAQEPQSLAERLGYPADAKLLIVHADDIGMSHSVNRATIAAMEKGLVNSGSIMVPCPWFPEIAAFAKQNPEADLGLHLTLTSEWKDYRWDGVLGAGATPSLHDSKSFLHAATPDVARHADIGEVEREIRSQVERAIEFGIRPTHLDSHMGSLFASPGLLQVYLQIARDYKIAAMLPREALRARAPQLLAQLPANTILIDWLVMATPQVSPDQWEDFYARALEEIRPGVTEIIVHLGFDDSELQSVTADHPDFGSAWRQRDFEVFTSDRIERLLAKHQVRMLTWREISSLLEEEKD